MKKPARKKRGGPKPAPAVVLKATASSTNQVFIEKTKPGPQGGRPGYILTKELADEICHRIAHGSSLTQLIQAPDMPTHPTLRKWRQEHEWFASQYARAVEDRNDFWAAQIKDIADTPQLGTKTEYSDKFGEKTITGDMIEHRRLRVDTYKWLLSKLDRARFGDKVDLNHGGQPEGTPIKIAAIVATDPIEVARAYQDLMVGRK